MANANINDGLLWAFSHEAIERLAALTRCGVDLDLAVALLEQHYDEDEIYAIDGDRKAFGSE